LAASVLQRHKIQQALHSPIETIDYVQLAKDTFNMKEYELFEERAGIMEFDAGLARDIAEERAYLEIRDYFCYQ
jgi:hypothetical protein